MTLRPYLTVLLAKTKVDIYLELLLMTQDSQVLLFVVFKIKNKAFKVYDDTWKTLNV